MILKTWEEILGAFEKGNLAKDFAAEINKAGEALSHLDSGSATVTLKLKFSTKSEMVTVKADLETRLPKNERRSSNFFLTSDGRLSLVHPDQVSLDFDRARRDAVDAG